MSLFGVCRRYRWRASLERQGVCSRPAQAFMQGSPDQRCLRECAVDGGARRGACEREFVEECIASGWVSMPEREASKPMPRFAASSGGWREPGWAVQQTTRLDLELQRAHSQRHGPHTSTGRNCKPFGWVFN